MCTEGAAVHVGADNALTKPLIVAIGCLGAILVTYMGVRLAFVDSNFDRIRGLTWRRDIRITRQQRELLYRHPLSLYDWQCSLSKDPHILGAQIK